MKLTSVEIHPDKSSSKAILSFRDPAATNPYNIKGIVGLDVDAIVPRYYKGSGGSDFYNLSLMNRDVVIKVGLNPQFDEYKTYSDLRDNLYKMIASSRTGKVQLQFKNGTVIVAAVSGTITKYETALFEKTQEVQITIKCDEPMLKGVDPVIPLRDFETSATTSRITIEDNKSTAPHGFYFNLRPTAAIGLISLTDPDDPSWSFEINPVGLGGFLPGDDVGFSSDYNNKYLYLFRAGILYSLVDAITPGSVWPILFPGKNELLWSPDYVQWTQIVYFPTYWGV